ncbi:MAG: pilin [Candidatus Komeilibacteria bacterium]|nr:pilin [Candidatus Komeilibacteria bacterium]
MKNYLLLTFLLLILTFSVQPAEATNNPVYDNIMYEFYDVEDQVTGTTSAYLDNYVVNIIRYTLGFLGLLAVIMILISGFQWMTAGGNEDAVTKARKRLINAVIGLLIILAAYSITYFVFASLDDALYQTGGNN